MPIPIAHLDPSVVEEVPLDLWRQVFDAIGWPAPLLAVRDEPLSHGAVLDAITHEAPSDELLQVFEVVQSLGTDDGAEAIQEALADRRILRDVLPSGSSHRELALHLFLAQRGNAALAEVFARAQIDVQQQGAHRRYHEFFGGASGVVRPASDVAAALREATLEYCREHDLGDHVDVRAYDDGDGVHVFQILRSHRAQKPLAVVPSASGRSARATIQYRPVHGDVLRYESAHGRLRVAARAASIIGFYRRTLGRIVSDDETFFAREPAYSLRVLQEKGRAALEGHDLAELGQVRLTECLWERGDKELLHLRAPDCFRQIEELGLPLHEGTLLQAKFKLSVIGPSARPVTVTVRIPGRLDVSQPRHEALVDRFLLRVGVVGRPGPEDAPTLWALAPWRHPAAIWRRVFGRDTDALMERGVLRRIVLQSVPSPDQPASGNTLQTIRLPGGDYYGVGTEPEVPSRTLAATDLDGFELQPEQLARELRMRLSIESAPGTSSAGMTHDAVLAGRSSDDAVLDLGTVQIGDHRLYLAYAVRRPEPGALDRLRRRASGAPLALLCPTTDLPTLGLPMAALPAALPTTAQALRAAVAAAGLDEVVPAVHVAPDGARLVVDLVYGKVWIDGIEIPGLSGDTHPFLFVSRLAQAQGRPVASLNIKDEISGARSDDSTAVRQAKTKARACIGEAMAAGGRTLDIADPFPSVPGGAYRCALPSHVRQRVQNGRS